MNPLLIVISGPSGVGKDAVLDAMKKHQGSKFHFSVTATTRKQRPSELDGIDYHFLTNIQFDNLSITMSKPHFLDDMIQLCRIISKNIPFCRIDFYYNEKII